MESNVKNSKSLEEQALTALEGQDICQCHLPEGTSYSLDVSYLVSDVTEFTAYRAHSHLFDSGNSAVLGERSVVLLGLLTAEVDHKRSEKTPHIWRFRDGSGACDCVFRQPLHMSPGMRVAVTCWNYIPASAGGSVMVHGPMLEIVCARPLPCCQVPRQTCHRAQWRSSSGADICGAIVLLSHPVKLGGEWTFALKLAAARRSTLVTIIFKGSAPMQWHAALTTVAAGAWSRAADATVTVTNTRRAKLVLPSGGGKVLIADDSATIMVEPDSSPPASPACTLQMSCRSITKKMSWPGPGLVDVHMWSALASDPLSFKSDSVLHYIGTATSINPLTATLVLDKRTQVLLVQFPATSLPGLRTGCQVLLLNLQTFCTLDGFLRLAATPVSSVIPITFPPFSSPLLHWTPPLDVSDVFLHCQCFSLQDADAVLRMLRGVRGSMTGTSDAAARPMPMASNDRSGFSGKLADLVRLIWELVGLRWPDRVQQVCAHSALFSLPADPASLTLFQASLPRICTLKEIEQAAAAALKNRNADCSCFLNGSTAAEFCSALVRSRDLATEDLAVLTFIDFDESCRMVIRDASGQFPLTLSPSVNVFTRGPVLIRNFSIGICGIRSVTGSDPAPEVSMLITSSAVFASPVDCASVSDLADDMTAIQARPALFDLEFFVVLKLGPHRRPRDNKVFIESLRLPIMFAKRCNSDCTHVWHCDVIHGSSHSSHQCKLCWCTSSIAETATLDISGLRQQESFTPGTWFAATRSCSRRHATASDGHLRQAYCVYFHPVALDLDLKNNDAIHIIFGNSEPIHTLQQSVDSLVSPLLVQLRMALAGCRVHEVSSQDMNATVSVHGRVDAVTVVSISSSICAKQQVPQVIAGLEAKCCQSGSALPMQPSHLVPTGLRIRLSVILADCATADKIVCYVDPCKSGLPDGFIPGAWVSVFNCRRCVSQKTHQVYLKATAASRFAIDAGPDQTLCQSPTCSTRRRGAFAIPSASNETILPGPRLLRLELQLKHRVHCVLARVQRLGVQSLSPLSTTVKFSAQIHIEDGTGSSECLLEGNDVLTALGTAAFCDFPKLITALLEYNATDCNSIHERLQSEFEESASGGRQVTALLLGKERLVVRCLDPLSWHPILCLETGQRGAEEAVALNLQMYEYLHGIFRALSSSPTNLMLCRDMRPRQKVALHETDSSLAPSQGSSWRQVKVVALSPVTNAAKARRLLHELASPSGFGIQ